MNEGLSNPSVRRRIWTAFTISAVVSIAISVLTEVFLAPSSWMGATAINVVAGLIAWSYLLETVRPYSQLLKIGYPSAYFFVGIGLLLRILGILVLAISLSIRIQKALSANAAVVQEEAGEKNSIETNPQSLSRNDPLVASAVAIEPGLAQQATPSKLSPPSEEPLSNPSLLASEAKDPRKVGRATSGLAKVYSSTRLTIISAFLLGVLSLGVVWVYGLFANMINTSRAEDWNRKASDYESALAGYDWDVNSWRNGLEGATRDIEIATFLAAELPREDRATFMRQVERKSEIFIPDDFRLMSPEEIAALDMRDYGGTDAGTAFLRRLVEKQQSEAREEQSIRSSEPYRSMMIDSNIARAKRGLEAKYEQENPYPRDKPSPPAPIAKVIVPSNETRLWLCGIIVLAHVCIGLTVQLAKGVKAG